MLASRRLSLYDRTARDTGTVDLPWALLHSGQDHLHRLLATLATISLSRTCRLLQPSDHRSKCRRPWYFYARLQACFVLWPL